MNKRMRKKTNKRVDKKVFTNTARKSKKINLEPLNMRGGIRL